MKNLITLLFTFSIFTLLGQGPCSQEGTIIIDGDEIDAVFDGENSGLKLPMWLNAGTTIAAGDQVKFISIIEFNEVSQSGGTSLVYNQVVKVGAAQQTVPANKVWKIESIAKHTNPFSITKKPTTNAPICDGGNLTLSVPSTPGATYTWSGPNGNSSSNNSFTVSSASPADGGIYTVSATLNGCVYTDTITAIVNPLPINTFINTSATKGVNIIFTPDATGTGYSYNWSFASGSISTSTDENPVVQWSVGGTYAVTLTVTDNNGCTSPTNTVNLAVSDCQQDRPQSDFYWDASFVGTSINFSADVSGADSYSWTFDQATTGSGSTANFSTSWISSGTYNVTLRTEFLGSCFETTKQVDIYSNKWTFTNCSQAGPTGPALAQCNTAYSGTSLDGLVWVNEGIQEWMVPNTGKYRIEVIGARGGNNGGYPAFMSGDFNFTAGTILHILVGQEGVGVSPYIGGGGGGSFVIDHSSGSNIPLIVAGGGGGKGAYALSAQYTHASTNTGGNAGGNSGQLSGGTNGNGGQGNTTAYYSSGGGGYLTDGGDGYSSAIGGEAYINGGKGGGTARATGGFGGGGHTYYRTTSSGYDTRHTGAGGGGYSGGGGGLDGYSGGGGGSYNIGTNQANHVTTHTGHGEVIIYF